MSPGFRSWSMSQRWAHRLAQQTLALYARPRTARCIREISRLIQLLHAIISVAHDVLNILMHGVNDSLGGSVDGPGGGKICVPTALRINFAAMSRLSILFFARFRVAEGAQALCQSPLPPRSSSGYFAGDPE